MRPPPKVPSILKYFQERSDSMLEELRGFVELETPSRDAGRIESFVAAYSSLLDEAGLACRQFPGALGPQLLGELPGEDPPIVLVGHCDTVWPAGVVGERPVDVREGKFFGPGAYDMKAGLCIALGVARFLRDTGHSLRRRLQVFVAADEESGGTTGHPCMDDALSPGSTALVVEPPCPDGAVKVRRKGVGIYELKITGREAHAGVEPERGISAVDELARLVLEIHGWNDPARGIQLNVGTIVGGTAGNVVAGSAAAGIDLRFDLPADGEEMERRLLALEPANPGASLEVDGSLCFPPLVPTPETLRLGEMACSIASELGLEISTGSSGGGSDGSYLSSKGHFVLDGMGVEGGGAHALDEHIVLESLPVRAALLTGMVLAVDEDGLEAPKA